QAPAISCFYRHGACACFVQSRNGAHHFADYEHGASPVPLCKVHRASGATGQGSRRKTETVTMKTKSKLSAYILRGGTAALLLSCVIVALCSAINLPEQPPKARPPQDNAAFGANAHQNRSLSLVDRVTYQRAIEGVYWRHRIWPKERPDSKPS